MITYPMYVKQLQDSTIFNIRIIISTLFLDENHTRSICLTFLNFTNRT